MVHLSHVHLPVPDLARSLAFYTDQLGLDVGYTSESMAEFPSAGLVLDEDKGFKRSDVAVTVGMGVDNVDTVFADLEARGVRVAEPPTDPPAERPASSRYEGVSSAESRGSCELSAVHDASANHPAFYSDCFGLSLDPPMNSGL